MRNLLFKIQYDGTAYHGFQVQENALSVCEVFQDAVESVLGTRWDVKGCSRTDTGVHALDYRLSMKLTQNIPCLGLQRALNRRLPDDIVVKEIEEVPLDFHARYYCIGKEYTYRVFNSRNKDPFTPTQRYLFGWPIDENQLEQAAQVLVGKHDFSAFCTKGHLTEDTVRTIYSISVERIGDEVRFVIAGDGFLYNMVRIIVGTLLSISMGRIQPEEISTILASKDRKQAGKTAPPHGLYLSQVDYPKDVGG